MFRYQKLPLKYLENIDALKAELHEKKIIPSKSDFHVDGINALMNILAKRFIKTGTKNRLETFVSSNDKGLTKKTVEEIINVVTDPQNYVPDLLCAIFMRFGDYAVPNGYGQAEKEIQIKVDSAWMRESNADENDVCKVNKNSVNRCYPVQVECYEGKVVKIGGTCMPFHYVMISPANIGMFDLDSEISSLKRYSYMRAYKIYEELKDTPLQNLLLAELSLGIGYTSFLYSRLRKIRDKEKLDKILEAIKPCSKMELFFIRKKILERLFDDLRIYTYEKNELDEICGVLNALLETVSAEVCKIYDRVLNIWWATHLAFGKVKDFGYIHSCLISFWDGYYNDKIVYKDHVKHFGIYDWRNITCYQNCFNAIPDFTLFNDDSDKIKEGKIKKRIEGIEDISYPYLNFMKVMHLKDKVLLVESFCNEIGYEIQERVVEELNLIELPESLSEIYFLYYEKIENVYNELRSIDKSVVNVDVKRPKGLKCIHLYAEIHYEVMKALLA